MLSCSHPHPRVVTTTDWGGGRVSRLPCELSGCALLQGQFAMATFISPWNHVPHSIISYITKLCTDLLVQKQLFNLLKRKKKTVQLLASGQAPKMLFIMQVHPKLL